MKQSSLMTFMLALALLVACALVVIGGPPRKKEENANRKAALRTSRQLISLVNIRYWIK